MENDTLKQLVREQLESPEKKGFNQKIIDQVKAKPKKQKRPLFSEKTLVHWFLFIAAFVLFFYVQQASKWEGHAILIGSVVSALPLYLVVFHKIYSLKNQYP
ncbi:MAG: hypothetical protein AAGC45_08145 [Bacteroidota bacterium]